jgi:hypothetical protein
VRVVILPFSASFPIDVEVAVQLSQVGDELVHEQTQ